MLSVLISSTLLAFASPASAANESDCTIVGTKNADVITGTEKRDVICAGAGADKIYALGGNDIIRAGSGNDLVYAGAGNDAALGEAGNDTIAGADGADKLDGGDGLDKVTGGNGEDLLQGGAGNDNLSAGNGADLIDGGKGKDTIYSGYGYDLCNFDTADVRLDACTLDSKGPKFGPTTSVVRQVQAGTLAGFTVNVSDGAGVAGVYGSIGGAPGWITEWCGFRIPTELVSGTDKSGTYKLTCTIPPNAVNENYQLFVGAVDMMGRTSEQIIAFEVLGGSSDNRTPTVTKIELPASVTPGENFVIRVEATDESIVAGIDFWLMLEGGSFQNENGLHAKGSAPRVISFTPTDSIFEQDYLFGDNAPLGTYRVWIGVRDGVGNRDFYDSGKTITLAK
jgi:Ca2+-binding RTX toxin-like protein